MLSQVCTSVLWYHVLSRSQFTYSICRMGSVPWQNPYSLLHISLHTAFESGKHFKSSWWLWWFRLWKKKQLGVPKLFYIDKVSFRNLRQKYIFINMPHIHYIQSIMSLPCHCSLQKPFRHFLLLFAGWCVI